MEIIYSKLSDLKYNLKHKVKHNIRNSRCNHPSHRREVDHSDSLRRQIQLEGVMHKVRKARSKFKRVHKKVVKGCLGFEEAAENLAHQFQDLDVELSRMMRGEIEKIKSIDCDNGDQMTTAAAAPPPPTTTSTEDGEDAVEGEDFQELRRLIRQDFTLSPDEIFLELSLNVNFDADDEDANRRLPLLSDDREDASTRPSSASIASGTENREETISVA